MISFIAGFAERRHSSRAKSPRCNKGPGNYNHRQNQLGRLYNLTVVHFNPEKTEFSLLLNIPRPPYSMLGYNRTIARTNINVLINIGPGVGGGRKRRGKKGNLPNTFDDDCKRIGNQL